MSAENSRSIYSYCSVPRCKKNPKHTCFTLPSDPEKAKIWCQQLGINENSKKKIFICEVHFEDPFINEGSDLKSGLPTIKFPALDMPTAKFPAIDMPADVTHSEIRSNLPSCSINEESDLKSGLPTIKFPALDMTTAKFPAIDMPADVTHTEIRSNLPSCSASTSNVPHVLSISHPQVIKTNTNFQYSNPEESVPTLKIEIEELDEKNDNYHLKISPQDITTSNLPVNDTNSYFQCTDLQQTTSEFILPDPVPTPTRTNTTLQFPEDKTSEKIQSSITPQNDNYNDLMTDVIINTLNSPSHRNIANVNPLNIAIESTSTADKRSHDDLKSKKVMQNKKQKTCPTQSRSNKDLLNTPIIIEEIQKQIDVLSKLPNVLTTLAVKMFLRYPQAYKMLHTSLNLPPVSALKNMYDASAISTDNDTLFVQTLQYKLCLMSIRDKNCVVCLGETNVKKNLYYDIKLDKLLGISDLNGIQKPDIACRALVLTVQGLFADWKQPIAIAYVGANEDLNVTIKQWVQGNIQHLLKIGYNVRAFVSEMDYLTIMPIQNRKTIYNLNDVPLLFKLLYHKFLTHDFFYNGEYVRRRHILEFYAVDSKKQFKLCPQLTDKHMKPAKMQDINVKLVTEVFSFETAAAMSVYIDFLILEASALSTVQFITDMKTLFDILYINNLNESTKLPSGETHVQFLRKILALFYGFKLVNRKTKKEVNTKGTFVEKFETTIKSILMLYEDMKSNHESDFIPTRRLTLDNVGLFLDRIKQLCKNSKKPTCKEINSAFIQSTLINILKPTCNSKCVDLQKSLHEIKQFITYFQSHKYKTPEMSVGAHIKINCREYNTLQLKRKDAIVLLAGFLLKKCYDYHADCAAMKNYICIVLHDTSSICKSILSEIQRGICVVPQESFIEFVEMMEIRFRSFMSKNILETRNGKIINGLLTAMELVNFHMPCPCFPILYAKKLYLRVRIYNMLKHNNTILNYEKAKYILDVNNL